MDLEEICYMLDIVCFADLNHGLSKESEIGNFYLRYLADFSSISHGEFLLSCTPNTRSNSSQQSK